MYTTVLCCMTTPNEIQHQNFVLFKYFKVCFQMQTEKSISSVCYYNENFRKIRILTQFENILLHKFGINLINIKSVFEFVYTII